MFPPRAAQAFLRYSAAVAIVAAITFLCHRLISVNALTAGFSFLVAVLVIATWWGLGEALVASVVAVLCFNFFFFEPLGTFNIAEPENWVALLAFLVTAVIASELSAAARRRAQEAEARRQEMERLYALSRSILLAAPTRSAVKQIAEQTVEIFELRAVAVWDSYTGETYRAGPDDRAMIEAEDRLRQGITPASVWSGEDGTHFVPVALGGRSIGALAVRGAALSETALQALANLIAIGLERVRGQEAASRAEAARQSEELKSTLLDAIAHEFQTPLTSIKASATAMLSAPTEISDEQRELASIVNEESDRLSRLVTEAIQMARFEAGKIQLNKGLHRVGDLVNEVLNDMKPKTEGRKVGVVVADDLPMINADGPVLELALRQLLDNALRYSPPGSPLEVRAAEVGRHVTISVADRGPGVPDREKAHLFEKFYRSPQTPHHVTGSGMGLAIAREILRAHEGEISVEDNPGGGSVFSMVLPAVEAEQR